MKKYSTEITMVLFIIIASLLVWAFNSCTYYICDCEKPQTKVVWYDVRPYGYKKLPWDFNPSKDPWSNIEPKCTVRVIKHIDRIGIGTTAPNYRLQINKGIKTTDTVHFDSCRIRIENAERGIGYPNLGYELNIIGQKKPIDTIK